VIVDRVARNMVSIFWHFCWTMLIILAFLIHTVLEWIDSQYRLLQQKAPSRRRFFEDIRILTSYLYFDSWDSLIDFMLQSFTSPLKSVESD